MIPLAWTGKEERRVASLYGWTGDLRPRGRTGSRGVRHARRDPRGGRGAPRGEPGRAEPLRAAFAWRTDSGQGRSSGSWTWLAECRPPTVRRFPAMGPGPQRYPGRAGWFLWRRFPGTSADGGGRFHIPLRGSAGFAPASLLISSFHSNERMKTSAPRKIRPGGVSVNGWIAVQTVAGGARSGAVMPLTRQRNAAVPVAAESCGRPSREYCHASH
jgi:hypothetical protein